MDRANENPFFVVQTCLGTQLNLQEDDDPNMHGQVCKIGCHWNGSGWIVVGSYPPPGFVALVEPPGDRWLGNKFSKNFASDIAEIAAKIDSAHKPGLLIIGLPTDLKVDQVGCHLSRNDDRPPIQEVAFPVLLMARHLSHQVVTAIYQSHKPLAFTRRLTERRTYFSGTCVFRKKYPRPAKQLQGNMLDRFVNNVVSTITSVASSFTAPKLLSAELDKLLVGSPLGVLKAIEAIRTIVEADEAGTLQLDMEKVCGMLVQKATADDFGLYLLLAWFIRRSLARKPTPSGDEEDVLLTSCFESLLFKHVFDGSWRSMACIDVLQEERATFDGQTMMNHFSSVISSLLEGAHLRASTIKGLVELQQLHATCLQQTGSESLDFRKSWMLLFRALAEAHMQQGLQPLLNELSTVLQVRTSYGNEHDHEFGPEDHQNLVKVFSPLVQTVTDFAMLVTICHTSTPELRVFTSTEAGRSFERAIANDFNTASKEGWVWIAKEICQILSMLPHRSHDGFSKIADLAVRGACSHISRDGFAPLDTMYACAADMESMSRQLLLDSLTRHAKTYFSKLTLPLMSDWLNRGTWDALRCPGYHDVCEYLTRGEHFRLHSQTNGDFSQVLALFSVLLKRLEGDHTAEVHVRRMFCNSVDVFLAVDVSAGASRRQHAVMSLVRSLGDVGIEFSSCEEDFARTIDKALQQLQASHTSSSHRRSGENENAKYELCAELCKVLNGLNIETLPSLLDQVIESSVAVTITGRWGAEQDAQLLYSRFTQMINSARSMAARQFVLALVLRCLRSCPSDLSSCTVLLAHCKPIEEAYAHRSLNDPAKAFLCVTYELANRVSLRFATASRGEAAFAEIGTFMANVTRSFEESCAKTRDGTITGMELESVCTQWVVLNALEDAIVFLPDYGKSLPSFDQLEQKRLLFVEAVRYLHQQLQFAAAMTSVGVDRSALADHDDAIRLPERCDVVAVLHARAAMEAWMAPMQPHAEFFEYFYMATQRTKSILFEHMLAQQLRVFTEALSPSAFAGVLFLVKEKLEKLLQAEEVDLVEMQEAGAQRVQLATAARVDSR